MGTEVRKKWGSDQERREAIGNALANSKDLKDFAEKYDTTFGGKNGRDLFNLEYDTPSYGNVDVDWMLTLLAAHHGRGGWLLKGEDPAVIYAIGKSYWIPKDAWDDPNVNVNFDRYGQANELAAIKASQDLLAGRKSLYEVFGIKPDASDECSPQTGGPPVAPGRNTRGGETDGASRSRDRDRRGRSPVRDRQFDPTRI
jgi:hypothetical protein